MKTLLPLQWEQEWRQEGLLNAGAEAFVSKKGWQFCDDLDCQMQVQDTPLDQDLKEMIVNASVITFDQGLDTLSAALENNLTQNPNVEIRKGQMVESITNRDGTYNVRSPWLHTNEGSAFNHVDVLILNTDIHKVLRFFASSCRSRPKHARHLNPCSAYTSAASYICRRRQASVVPLQCGQACTRCERRGRQPLLPHP